MKKPGQSRIGRSLSALAVATAIWIPSLHWFFTAKEGDFHQPSGISTKARQLASRHLALWSEPEARQQELNRMRASNAEWDFMGRTFLVWSLADMSLRNPEGKSQYVAVMDQIIVETLRLEKEHGMYFFLMPYARAGNFVMQPPRSQFLDSEIALMLASRRWVAEKAEYIPLLRERIAFMGERMAQGAVLSTESYPNECWMFDNAAALAAFRLSDRLDGGDHSDFIHRWIQTARAKLTDPVTGILISSYTVDGRALDGPEGSSIWMVTHFLRLADGSFARDQYQRARKELARGLAGFAWSREWPASWQGPTDIDSGPVIPVLGISAGASGMALIGASSAGDEDYLQRLVTTLDFAAFPARKNGRLRYCASNAVGDAALLYASVLGPVWNEAITHHQP